jgi:hypothetical protein
MIETKRLLLREFMEGYLINRNVMNSSKPLPG